MLVYLGQVVASCALVPLDIPWPSGSCPLLLNVHFDLVCTIEYVGDLHRILQRYITQQPNNSCKACFVNEATLNFPGSFHRSRLLWRSSSRRGCCWCFKRHHLGFQCGRSCFFIFSHNLIVCSRA